MTIHSLNVFLSNLEPVCSMCGSNCCFLTCIQISQEAGQVVWYSHLLKNFPQFVVIHSINIPLVCLIFLKRSLAFPIQLFYSIFYFFHWLLRKAFLSLLAILWNSEFKWVYLSFSPLPLASFAFYLCLYIERDMHSLVKSSKNTGFQSYMVFLNGNMVIQCIKFSSFTFNFT